MGSNSSDLLEAVLRVPFDGSLGLPETGHASVAEPVTGLSPMWPPTPTGRLSPHGRLHSSTSQEILGRVTPSREDFARSTSRNRDGGRFSLPPSPPPPGPTGLARLFGSIRRPVVVAPNAAQSEDEIIRRLEQIIENWKDLPASKLRDELKETQERLTRVESLLVSLTRSMHNDRSN